MDQGLTHLTEDGRVAMVDVSGKEPMRRVAVAESWIELQPDTLKKIAASEISKGNVLAVAQVAAISAVKRTDELIPLCHSLPVLHVDVAFALEIGGIRTTATVVTVAATGVEMEALTAVSVAALTIYDMCKAVDQRMQISGVRLLSKTKAPL